MVVRRGQIYWCNLDPVIGHEQGSRRPVVVISADEYNDTQTPLVAIVPLTKAAPKSPLHFVLPKTATGLSGPSTVLIDHAKFLDRSRLVGEPIGQVSQSSMVLFARNLKRVLDI
jgi:mRNA interferase MazF